MRNDLPPDLSSNASDALRAARADDRLYDPLCLNRLERVIPATSDARGARAEDGAKSVELEAGQSGAERR